jgi:hypothetical protein
VSIVFNLKDMCNDSLKANVWEVIDKYGIKLNPNINGNFELEKGESYFITTQYHREDYMKLINFTYRVVNDQKSDTTIIIPQIMKFHNGNSVNFEERYFNCYQLCNGHCVDYYTNGVKRLEGNFSEGKPVGKLIFYSPTGIIDYIEKYNKKGKLINKINL